MPAEQPAVHDSTPESAAVPGPETAVYEQPLEDSAWPEETDELPRRPRRRLLAPVPLALLGVLLIACGFIGGVLVEKGQNSSSSSTGTSSLASRVCGSARQRRLGRLAHRRRRRPGVAGAGGATSGEVTFIQGNELYVSTAEGNTVKVSTSAGSTVTKTVKSSVKDIHPGETVVVTGSKGANGAISAESIRVGSAGAAGGLGALFGGGGGAGGSGAAGAGGGTALFGSGG